MERKKAVEFLLTTPYKLGHLLGFSDLTELHNRWILDMICCYCDKTLQAHRGSYKTTCVSIALSIIVVLMPKKKTMFMRKTDTDVKEVIEQVRKILISPQMKVFVRSIYGVDVSLTKSSVCEINTNLSTDLKGMPQLIGIGIGGSITGKHFDIIFTDDIVNIRDRYSRADREQTKRVYQELHNIVNRGGRIFNTGTPWHKDDCFTMMPKPEVYDCYSTGLIPKEKLAEIRSSMTASLFAANYELRHIAAENIMFDSPSVGGSVEDVANGICHVDAAYDGEDFTAFTAGKRVDGTYFIFGKLWRKHVDDVSDEICRYYMEFLCTRLYCEDNGDKGYLAKNLRSKGISAVKYHESMNKEMKIETYLKHEWKHVVFVTGTDDEYIRQICDYTPDADHDDAPDSLACVVQRLRRKTEGQKANIFE